MRSSREGGPPLPNDSCPRHCAEHVQACSLTNVTSAAEPREHRRLALALIVIAALLAFLSLFALWANRQLLNTDNWTDSSSKLLENDKIRTQLSIFLVDQLYANVDVAAELRKSFPKRAAPLAGPAAGGLRQVAERGVNVFLERPRVQAAWEQANRRAHKRLLDLLEDRGKALKTGNGNVTLDLQTLLAQSERLSGLSQKLPAGAAQITILRSDQLRFAQDIVHLLKVVAIGLVVLSLGLFALAIYLARGWRRQALRATGIGLAAAGAAGLVVRGLAGDTVVGSLAKTDSIKPALDATWSISTSLLQQAAVATLAYGVVIIFSAWLAGPTRPAVSTRGALAPWIRQPSFAYGGLAVILLLIVAWGPTPATQKVLSMLILAALLAFGLEVLRRQTAREYPDASREEQRRRLRAWFSRARLRRASPTPSGDDRLEQLERLGRLHESGVIDSAEFEREKARLLGEASAQAG
jgi:putative oligomerization/nucleic acid binding protein